MISEDPKAHCGQLETVLDYVALPMKGRGIRERQPLMTKDAWQMARHPRPGRLGRLSAGIAMMLGQRARTTPKLFIEQVHMALQRALDKRAMEAGRARSEAE